MSLNQSNAEASSHNGSPLRAAASIAAIIFVVEFFVMGCLANWHLSETVVAEAIIDASMLTIFCSPLILLFVIKPFVLNARRAEMEAKNLLTVKQHQAEHLAAVCARIDLQKVILEKHALVTESDSAGKITYVNDTLCQTAGYTRDQLLGQPHGILNSGRHDDAMWQQMFDTVSAGQIWQHEICNQKRDGTPFWILTTIAATKSDDNTITGFISAGTDITLNKLREEMLQATHEQLKAARATAEEASLAKSQFLANMSHEIRTPMNGVFGMTDLLARTNLDDRQRKLVSTIQDSAKSLLTIINDILDLSRIEAGKLELDSQDFNLRDGLEGTIELFAIQANHRGLNLSVYIADDVPAYVNGDQGRIKQICTNLIGNALKFTKSGGVALRVVREGGTAELSHLRFEVKDTGIGVDPVTRDKLFQPFIQAETSISRRFGGTGLGLSIARHLVEMMRGTIEMHSVLGSGTTVSFVIELPHVEGHGSGSKPDYAALRGARVMVIDDSSVNRDIVADYLEHCKAEVTAVESTALAWPLLVAAAAQERPFHVAVVDMLMPGENGLEFAERIKATRDLARLKIVLATSINWDGDLASVRAAGIEAILTKPIRRQSLVDEVSRVAASVRHQGWRPRPVASLAANPDAAHLAKASKRKLKAHVLLAEDNPVNIAVAQEYLAGLGCTMSIAVNGLEAVAFANSEAYDIILMDCQMPLMDGLEATRRIRANEKRQSTGGSRIPIVAVTANAFNEDRVQCIDAGMDDHLGKPFSQAQLEAMLIKWVSKIPANKAAKGKNAKQKVSAKKASAAVPAPISASLPAAAERPSCLDRDMLLQLQSGHPGLFQKMIETFLTWVPEIAGQLDRANDQGDREALRLAAHSLKSSSANVGATKVTELCRTAEKMAGGNTQSIAGCRGVVKEISIELQLATAELKTMLEEARLVVPKVAKPSVKRARKTG